jgi:multiple sugar transport system permease protein
VVVGMEHGRRVPFYRRLGFQEERDGWLFAMPAILGLVFFTLGPVVASLYLSFTDYDIVNPPKFVALANYIKLFADDSQMRHSLLITFYFALAAVPLGLIIAFLVALLMNAQVKGIALFRTVWYLPALVSAVATGTLWRYALNTDFGLVNLPLKALGLPPVEWLTDPTWTVPSLILIQLWGIGNTVLIYLAGLQGVPAHLYEAAEIDGAGAWAKFRHVTLPMMSAVVFFNLVLGIIGALQVFTIVYVIFTPQGGTGLAGPEDAALFYVLYLYRNGFQYFKMGYASALAWILFLIIMILTALVFRSQSRWVYYEGERAR